MILTWATTITMWNSGIARACLRLLMGFFLFQNMISGDMMICLCLKGEGLQRNIEKEREEEREREREPATRFCVVCAGVCVVEVGAG
jgi:hypothetical protein